MRASLQNGMQHCNSCDFIIIWSQNPNWITKCFKVLLNSIEMVFAYFIFYFLFLFLSFICFRHSTRSRSSVSHTSILLGNLFLHCILIICKGFIRQREQCHQITNGKSVLDPPLPSSVNHTCSADREKLC